MYNLSEKVLENFVLDRIILFFINKPIILKKEKELLLQEEYLRILNMIYLKKPN